MGKVLYEPATKKKEAIGTAPIGGVERMMAMPQRDDPPLRCALRRTSTIEAIKRLEPPSRVRYGAPSALLEYAVMHGNEAEAERIREELRRLTDEV